MVISSYIISVSISIDKCELFTEILGRRCDAGRCWKQWHETVHADGGEFAHPVAAHCPCVHCTARTDHPTTPSTNSVISYGPRRAAAQLPRAKQGMAPGARPGAAGGCREKKTMHVLFKPGVKGGGSPGDPACSSPPR